jgi:two-component system, chemotaxis family, CheB/CheR fusion protein
MTAPGEARARTILLVDDNRDAVLLLSRVLARWGHTVHTAYDGGEALVQAKAHHPEVVLLDIGLPDMDGYAVASALRAEGVPSVLVAVTGFGQDDDRTRAGAAGFAHHLLKPVDLDALRGLLDRL